MHSVTPGVGSDKRDEEQKCEDGLEIEVEDEATVEEESKVLECNDSNDGLVVTPFFTEDEGSLRPYLNLDGHMEFHSEEYFDCLDDSTRGQIGNLDDQRRWSHGDEGEDQKVLNKVGAGDNGAGNGGEVSTSGAKGPDPPYPPDTPPGSDCDREDAGYGSGADCTVLKSEREVTWFPPMTGERSLKRKNQSRFGSGFQGEPPFVTDFTKRRKVQAFESETLDSASLIQFALLAQPCSQDHVPEPKVGDRPGQWCQWGHHGGGLLASSQELWRPPGMPGIQPRSRGAAKRADSGGQASWQGRRGRQPSSRCHTGGLSHPPGGLPNGWSG